jgi:hypothetical protein
VIDVFRPREQAAVEYWFWKLHVGDLAFLLDVIVRRSSGLAEVRPSLWLRGGGRVEHDVTATWTVEPGRVVAGATDLRPGQSVGRVSDIAWDLHWEEGAALVSPLRGVLARLEPFDTSILIRPQARFWGTIEVGGEVFEVTDTPGAFYHYWGRRLMDRWVWLSATLFDDDPERRVEAIVCGKSHLFGRLPYPIPLSYVWTTDGERTDLIVSTVNGMVRTKLTLDGIVIGAIGLTGARHRITARWGAVPANGIGEGIVQTMHADATIDGIPASSGTVGLEMRGWPRRAAKAGEGADNA